MLHRTQKYEVDLSLFEDLSITTTGIYACLTDEIWWLQRLPQYSLWGI
ncbi:MAG: hypothetical protein K2Y07_12695 [Nitrosomonas sp.]|nr:hypothetical protein [Nitrosomonas sp.]